MTTTTGLQTSPYLREQRQFPRDDVVELARQTDQAYIDIASKVNNRTIGIYPINFEVITGESWYLSGSSQKQQTLRQVYSFGAIAPGAELDIPVGKITFTQFTHIYGTVVTNVPDYRPLPYANPLALNADIALLVGPVAGQNQIRIVVGAGSPAITGGLVVLEWLSPY